VPRSTRSQPSPMITTSFFGSLVTGAPQPVRGVQSRGPVITHGGRGKRSLWRLTQSRSCSGPGYAIIFPRDHVTIAAVDRVGEEPHLHVFDGLFEKGLSSTLLV